LGESPEKEGDAQAVLAAYARLYDERGGGVEIDMLGQLAHNVVVWAKRWLVEEAPKLRRYGVQRIVRDVLAVSGFVELGKTGTVKRVVLNGASALGRACAKALRVLLEAEHVRITWAKRRPKVTVQVGKAEPVA
jgi:hypothetical protein